MKANLFNQPQHQDGNEAPHKHEEQVRFESELGHMLPTIVSVIEQAHQNMTRDLSGKHPDFISHLSKPVRMHEQIKGLMYEVFGDSVKKLRYNRFGLFLGNYVLLFKKLDDAGRPSNISTSNANMLMSQTTLNYPGQPIIIHAGYVVGRTWEDIKRIFAVSMADRQVEWISNLREFANKQTNLPYLGMSNPPADDIVVQPKNKKDNSATN